MYIDRNLWISVMSWVLALPWSGTQRFAFILLFKPPLLDIFYTVSLRIPRFEDGKLRQRCPRRFHREDQMRSESRFLLVVAKVYDSTI